ncbi:lipocalin-like domain-containing protein [Sphingobacterium paucimobilis]|uniref:Lipocalin-like domain-containing protein n=1 Tax=Sphingobacterium paucimobilis HER1398 TaxID=1346330 RepID=U2IZJ1_9SPHI|nr:lipocalin-like domain-containing protein [Sphingobacterium paucimobilis]ERJ58089.1 hypothetical protein M472_04855 [Sphingobacterium paucimobilis HER1398]
MTSIKNEIIGTWELLSYIEVPINGIDSSFPFGKTPKGLLLYSPDGYMSVQISASDDLKYRSDDRMHPSEEESQQRMRGYLAFSGRYTVDNRRAHVVYDIESSFFPNWEGIRQVRKLDFDGDILFQKSLDPIRSDGRMVHAHMTWKRTGKEVDMSEYEEDSLVNTWG